MMDYDIIMQQIMMPFCAMFKAYLLGICMCIMRLTQSTWKIGQNCKAQSRWFMLGAG